PFPRMADRELEAGRLAAGLLAQPGDELEQAERRRERAVRGRRYAVDADRHAARRRDLGADLRRRQHAAVAGLRALRQLDLDHFPLWGFRIAPEALLAERAAGVAAAEVAGADLPGDVAAVLAVVRRDRALAGVVIEAAAARALVQCADRVRRQRAE